VLQSERCRPSHETPANIVEASPTKQGCAGKWVKSTNATHRSKKESPHLTEVWQPLGRKAGGGLEPESITIQVAVEITVTQRPFAAMKCDLRFQAVVYERLAAWSIRSVHEGQSRFLRTGVMTEERSISDAH
jgi:hypothetical protein